MTIRHTYTRLEYIAVPPFHCRLFPFPGGDRPSVVERQPDVRTVHPSFSVPGPRLHKDTYGSETRVRNAVLLLRYRIKTRDGLRDLRTAGAQRLEPKSFMWFSEYGGRHRARGHTQVFRIPTHSSHDRPTMCSLLTRRHNPNNTNESHRGAPSQYSTAVRKEASLRFFRKGTDALYCTKFSLVLYDRTKFQRGGAPPRALLCSK